MFESDSSLVVILLSSILGVSLLLLTTILGISRALDRLERRLADLGAAQGSAPSASETAAGGAFETFLAEDPRRRQLPKAEQFAEYRRWRQEQGLNWSGS
jgi:hypothetical protein